MKKIFVLLVLLVGLSSFSPEQPEKSIEHTHATSAYTCPEDDFNLIWTGETKFCQGLKCRTMKKYYCSVYSNEHIYWIYTD